MSALYDRDRGLISVAGMAVLVGVSESVVRSEVVLGAENLAQLPASFIAEAVLRLGQVEDEHGITDIYDAIDVLAAAVAS